MIRQFFAALTMLSVVVSLECFGQTAATTLAWGAYRGDRLAIYCYNNRNDEGYVDVDYFHYRYSK